ncbi:MAG: putative glycolipid-binding domain-containing protein [Solirubrobacterales bacterium]
MGGFLRRRAVTWVRDDSAGAEYAEFEFGADRLRATGAAIGAAPLPHRLEYSLETAAGFATTRVELRASGLGWSRSLELCGSGDGAWTGEADSEGDVELPAPGGDLSRFGGALDPDLELSPAFNTLPVLRHGLLESGDTPPLSMVWIAVPSLALHRSEQRYSHRGRDPAGRAVVRFEGLDPDAEDFAADLVFDDDGLVIEYPTIARRTTAHAPPSALPPPTPRLPPPR